MNVLVLTSEAISAEQLRSALSGSTPAQDAEVMVVAPALQESALRFWLSDADAAIGKAEAVSSETVDDLEQEGIAARGDTGESEPLKAIEDALKEFSADRIVLFTRPSSDQGYREEVEVSEIERRFGLPVDHVSLAHSAD